MSGVHHRGRWSVLSVMAAGVLALATAPAQAVPPAPDPASMVSQVGPAVINIDTHMGYQGAVGAGTGIVLDPNGVVLTNNHVISGATEIRASSVATGQAYDVDVLGYDRTHDVAVLQLRGAFNLPPANIGTANGLAIGDPVVAMGNAGGQGGTPSAVPGRITGLNQTVSAADELTGSTENLTNMIKADTPIRPGDSGGPMVNAVGQVIGMNTAASGNYQFAQPGGEGFAIPIDQAMAIAGDIRAGRASGTVHIGPTGFLGVGVVDADGAGARVENVLADTPAAQAGIAQGDMIIAVDGARVDSATTLTNLLDLHHPGDTVQVTVTGLGGTRTVAVTLAPGPIG